MEVEEYIRQCKIMHEKTQKDKELKKVYSDVHFLALIQEAEEYKRNLDFADKLFNI